MVCAYLVLDSFSDVSIFVCLAAHKISLLKNEISRLISRSQIAYEFSNLAQAFGEPHCIAHVVALEKISDTSRRVRADLACPVSHI